MRRPAAFLALLLCLYWTRAQGESGGLTENDVTQRDDQNEILSVKATSDQTNISPDIWAELKALREMVIQHSLELRKLEQENTAIQARLTASENKNAVLEARINTSDNKVEELERENTDLLARVTATENKSTVLETRLNASENLVKELQRENSVLEARLNTAENMLEELKRKNTVLEARMSSNENEVEELKRENAEQPKVAFSVGLTDTGYVGPFSTDMTLKFSRILTNVGQAYDPTTGFFTAPVRGTYYFRFNGFETRPLALIGIKLYHNNNIIHIAHDANDNIAFVNVSNGFVLQLEKGDVIYLVLWSGYGVYDDPFNYTTFSGFLLFAM
ncbi:heavy metal-binding protein HIP-like [Thunnus albacares]|uniref:heavy metal-binding protein HIP-like n=1 Tax=Thunnus albacares TaxID=8236 RepID=UPI001CF6C3E6|nr:heavy metal-binding protein HIP-like [Thunnus albacares]